MFKKSTIKKSAIVLVALLMCAVAVFAACTPQNAFKPVTMPASATPEGNGGIAVRYGEWIYYVNGYQSSYVASNSYANEIRVGSVVRIKSADLDDVIKINDQDLSSTKKTEAIKKAVAEKAETVVPNFYYTGNTTSVNLNGLYIFNDRIYITTPNSDLDANGNLLNSQLVLASYKLDGSDMQRHYVFKTNAPQLALSQQGNDVFATFVLDSKLSTLKVGDKEAKVLAEKITSPTFTNGFVYFLDEDGSICQHTIGSTETPKVLVQNVVEEGHEGHSHNTTYTIKSANGEYVYYTVSDGSQTSDLSIYYATATENNVVVLNTVPSGSYFGWKNKIVYTTSVPEEIVNMYGIWVTSGNGTDKKEILDPAQNDKAITFNKLEGDTLYYTVNSISYTLDLANDNATPVAYAYGLSTSATGWGLPDILGEYVFTLGTGSVSVVKFNPETKKNTTSTTITLTVIEEEKDK